MKKYNYFDDNDVNNSIYDQENDIYNIAKSIRERIKNENQNNSKSSNEDNIDKIIEEKNNKQTLADLKQKVRDGELFRNISWTNIRNSLSFKDTKLRIALPIIIILILTISISSFIFKIDSSNKKLAHFSAAAGQVCAQKTVDYGFCGYEKLNEKYGNDVNKLVGLCFARELDFDNDGNSELLICYNDSGVYFNEIFGFDKHNEFVSLYKKSVCNVDDITHGDFIAIYHHNNKYYIGANEVVDEEEQEITEDESHSNVQNLEFYTLVGNSFKKKVDYSYDYVNEAFTKKGKVNLKNFEKIKLSCIKYAESERRIAQAGNVINSFDTSKADITPNTNTQNQMYHDYYNIVKDYTAKYGSAKIVEENGITALNGLSVVKLVDFNGDNVEELMLIYRKDIARRSTDKKGNYISLAKKEYFCEIYKWTGEKAIRIFRSDCISSRRPDGADSFYIIKHNGNDNYYCENANTSAEKGKVTTSSAKIYKMNELNFEKTFSAVKENNWGNHSYYIDDTKVAKKEFNNSTNELPLFQTDSDEYDIKLYDIGFVKRKTDNKADVDNQLKSTIEQIQKLNKNYVHE